MVAELVEATMLLYFRGALLFRPFLLSPFAPSFRRLFDP